MSRSLGIRIIHYLKSAQSLANGKNQTQIRIQQISMFRELCSLLFVDILYISLT